MQREVARQIRQIQMMRMIRASIAYEYGSAWSVMAYGFWLWYLWLFVGMDSTTQNPVIAFTLRYAVSVGTLLLLIGSAHWYALYRWPDVNWALIGVRKLGSGVSLLFWFALTINSVLIIPRQPTAMLVPILTLPTIGFLALAVFRRRYTDW